MSLVHGDRFEQFLDGLKNKSVSIVYSYSNTIEKERTWYDRWRSSVIMYFGQGAETLGLEVRYVDVDTYLSDMTTSKAFPNDYVINLHSGLNRISSWPIISSLASWRRVPVAPCPSDVHITCERKDVTRAIAKSLKMRMPAYWSEKPHSHGVFVLKARDLGMSVGLTKSSDREILANAASRDDLIVEEFVAGFDATVGVLINPTGEYTILGGLLYVPKSSHPTKWMFTQEMKNLPIINDEYINESIAIEKNLEIEIRKLSRMLGEGAVYRFDFRLDPLPDNVPPKVMTLDNSWFLEVTPTPVISGTSSFSPIMNAAVSDPKILNELTAGRSRLIDRNLRPQTVLVANLLYSADTRNTQN